MYKESIKKVRDRCHETSEYKGPACYMRSLRYKQQNVISVLFYIGSGCDFSPL